MTKLQEQVISRQAILLDDIEGQLDAAHEKIREIGMF